MYARPVPVLALLIVFIVVPLAELYVLIQVGQVIGLLPTLAILLLDSIAGSLLLRSQGRAAWRRFSEAVAQRKVPARAVLDGVLVIFGGAFLITPGFITDIVGLLLLIPPTRAIARRVVVAAAGRRVIGGFVGGPPTAPRAGREYDVEGTATEQPRTADPQSHLQP